jgi:ATP-dependent Zn protease
VDYEKIGILNSHFILQSNEILSKTFLENELKVLLAGRVATQKVYGEFFSNAKEDIREAKLLTHKIIEEFAMTNEYFVSSSQAQILLHETDDEVKNLLSKLSVVLEKVTEYLLENESITPQQTKKLMDELF